ncbi:MAG: FAD-dependent oxidoreductase [bacterium]
MNTIQYNKSREIPVSHIADVMVIGGGPGGLGAAVMAAREGVDAMLIERYGQLGGMATQGQVNAFMHNHVMGNLLDKPVCREWANKMEKYRVNNGPHNLVEHNAAMLAAEELCLEAGVKLLYHHTLIDVVMDDTDIDYLIFWSKSGITAAKAKVYIDCTGDADLAVYAGCAYEQGGPDGACQPMTAFFGLENIDDSRVPSMEELQVLYKAAKERGEISCPQAHLHPAPFFSPGIRTFNWTRVLDTVGTDGDDLSKAEIIARQQIREVVAFFRKYVPGYENATIRSIATHIGIRETRRVIGQAFLTRDAFVTAAKFPDAIVRVQYPIDIHNPHGAGVELIYMPEGDWYEIPYGCIVPRDCGNLLIGGRPISVDHAIHSSMRIMPVACSVGSAAGIASAIAVKNNCRPKEVDGVQVRELLVRHGACL